MKICRWNVQGAKRPGAKRLGEEMVWGRNDPEPIEVTPILFLTGLVTTNLKKDKIKKKKNNTRSVI